MSQPMPNKQCARCWGQLFCNRESIQNCQCAGISLTPEQRTLIASLYSDCLCRRCLMELSTDQVCTSAAEQEVNSPCIGVCELDQKQHHCAGCYRTLEEVRRWRDLSSAEKQEVLHACEKRSQHMGSTEWPSD